MIRTFMTFEVDFTIEPVDRTDFCELLAQQILQDVRKGRFGKDVELSLNEIDNRRVSLRDFLMQRHPLSKDQIDRIFDGLQSMEEIGSPPDVDDYLDIMTAIRDEINSRITTVKANEFDPERDNWK